MKITATAPTRVDLAGGTIDIWPLYLYHQPACTINCGLARYAKATLETRKDTRIILECEDLDVRQEFDSIGALKKSFKSGECGKVSLLASVACAYSPPQGFELKTHIDAPSHSGLGGSSALYIALNGVFNMLCDRGLDKADMIFLSRDLEAQLIKTSTGLQDYYGAMFGAVSQITFAPGKVVRYGIGVQLKDIQDRLVLVDSGEPHHSAMSNWDMFKHHQDGDERIIARFQRISEIAHNMKWAFEKKDLDSVGRLIGEEWENRKLLSPLVTTPEIDRIISVATQNGAISGKVCGAGAGGCVVIWCKAGHKKAVESALKDAQCTVLECTLSETGLTIKTE